MDRNLSNHFRQSFATHYHLGCILAGQLVIYDQPSIISNKWHEIGLEVNSKIYGTYEIFLYYKDGG